jgi:hypothetical protein
MWKTQADRVCALDGRCVRFKHFYPLLAFLIPTAPIGYGVVIPLSPIAGVNGLTIGFGSAARCSNRLLARNSDGAAKGIAIPRGRTCGRCVIDFAVSW